MSWPNDGAYGPVHDRSRAQARVHALRATLSPLATFALATSARTLTTSPASLAAATLTATLSTAALGRPPRCTSAKAPPPSPRKVRGAISGLFGRSN